MLQHCPSPGSQHLPWDQIAVVLCYRQNDLQQQAYVLQHSMPYCVQVE